MSPIGKLFVVLNLVFSIAVLAILANILAKGEQYQKNLNDLEGKRAALDSELKTKTKTFDDSLARNRQDLERAMDENNTLKLDKQRLTDQVAEAGRGNDQLRGAVDQIKASLGEFSKGIQDAQARVAQLTDENTKLRAEKDAAVDKQRAAEDDRDRTQGELDTAKKDIADLEAKVASATKSTADLRNAIDAAQKIYPGTDIAKLIGSPEPMDCIVQDVNDESGFVVLSIGAQDNVRVGDKFTVYRESTFVGEVVVDTLYPDNSAARMVVRNAPFKKFDKASTKLGT